MLNNHWYIACASSQLDNQPRAVTLLGEPLVVYRDHEGRPHALEDRCCHRGVQLSLGEVTAEGRIACRYHGWQYDGSGRCLHVPSLCTGARIPEGFRVRSFACVEQDHYVWVWMGEDAAATIGPSPIRGIREGGWTQGVIESACSADRVLDNILDASHVPFVHTGTHWAYFVNKMFGFKTYEYEVAQTANGLAVFYPPSIATEAAAGARHLEDRVASYLEFELPDRLYVFQRGVKISFFLVIHAVRSGPNSTRVEWLMRSRERTQGVEWRGSENATLQEDRAMLESAQRTYDRDGADFERHAPADFATLQARRLVTLAREGGWPERRHEVPQRKLVLVRQ